MKHVELFLEVLQPGLAIPQILLNQPWLLPGSISFWEKAENPCTHENPGIRWNHGINKQRHDSLRNLAVDLWLNQQLHFWANFEPNTARPGPRGRPEDRSLDMEVHRVYNGREWENQWKSAINGYTWGHLLGDISTMWCMDVSENGNVTSSWWQVQYGTWW